MNEVDVIKEAQRRIDLVGPVYLLRSQAERDHADHAVDFYKSVIRLAEMNLLPLIQQQLLDNKKGG